MNTLYMDDSYLREFRANVARADGMNVILDRTAFYPQGGGQPGDIGTIEVGGTVFNVVNARKENGMIIHELDAQGLAEGDEVSCAVDWQRRYALMRMHTAAHLLSSVIHKKTGALVTGKQLGTDESRIDFSLENFNKEAVNEFAEEASLLARKGARVKTYFLPREEAMKIPGVVRLAGRTPPEAAELRIVEIEGMDIQACGGTHLHDIGEIGEIRVTGTENKGKTNRRIYYKLE
jgi:misacylated tRNA(Ala) deacylase